MKAKKILELKNEVDARHLASILDDEEIPHTIVSYHDTAYDGLFQGQMGWGHVESAEEYEDRIVEIFTEMKL